MSRLIQKYLRGLFNTQKVAPKHREALWQYYYDTLAAGVDKGYSPQLKHYDKELAHSLKHSIATFSAFKETAFRKNLEDLLVDEKGSIRTWDDFKKEALKVSDKYNQRWLQTEYHQTVANANMAAKWKSFEANAHLYPNIKLVAVNDERTRTQHKVLDGTVLPINDPFWQTHTPPLDWGCRCDIVQTDEPTTQAPPPLPLKDEFKNNPATSGKVFGKTVYLTSGGLNPEAIEEAAKFAARMFKKAIQKGKELAEKSKLLAPYKTIYKAKNGATVKVSPYADKKDLKENINTAKIIANQLGVSVKIRPHINLKGYKNPEYEINKNIADRKEVSSYTSIKSNLKKAKEQGVKTVVFDLSDFKKWEAINIARSLKGKILSYNNKKWLKEAFFIYGDKAISFEIKELITDFEKVTSYLKAIEP